MTKSRHAPSGPLAATPGGDRFRPDIEGLRGLAVGLVVLFHAGLLAVVGGFVGVDVFFVISGFLITGLLLRELERHGRIGFRAFYARRVRRLAPAGALVLLLTMAVVVVVVGPLDRPELLLDGAASALSFGNLRFAAAASDYFTAVATPSPFLHFWSLAVEEQFYLVWPALLAIVVGLARGHRPRRVVALTMVLVVVASFGLEMVVTDASVAWAFYSLPTRAWQLAAGGLVAVGALEVERLPDRVRAVVGALGLVAIGAAAFLLDGSVAYPGAAALAPTMGSVGVLIAAGRGPARLLTSPPLRFLGRISYSLYLWHWPLLVLPAIALGAPLAPNQSAGLVCVAIIAATLSWAFVETPFRTASPGPRSAPRPGRVVTVGVAGLVGIAIVAAGLAWQGEQALAVAAGPSAATGLLVGSQLAGATTTPDLPATPPPTRPATSLVREPSPSPSPSGPVSYALPGGVHPTPAGARADQTEAELRADGCMGLDATAVPPTCVYGDPAGTFTVALVGDSHAAQWFTALEAIAKARHWRLETFTKVRCPFIDDRMVNVALKREYTECEAWDRAVVARLVAHPADLTLISTDRNWIEPVAAADDTPAAEAASEARMVAQLPGRVGLILDTPSSNQDVPACLAAHERDIRPCAFSRAIADRNAIGVREQAIAAATGAGLLDLDDLVCPGDPCQPIVDDILIFRDDSHLTATFSLALAPALAVAIDAILPTTTP